jgi:hypothetical protein
MINRAKMISAVGVFFVALACGKTTDLGDAMADSGVPDDVPDTAISGCTWPNKEGGTIQCPADGKTVCPAGDGCNTCKCSLDGTPVCTTLSCH